MGVRGKGQRTFSRFAQLSRGTSAYDYAFAVSVLYSLMLMTGETLDASPLWPMRGLEM